jgi:polyisoprenoid-binding protein YceI
VPRTTRYSRQASLLGGIVTGGLLLGSAAAIAQEYHVALSSENSVRFISRAPLEEFEGVTDRIDGYVLLDQAGLGGSNGGDDTEFYFEVDLASLDTGIGLRNRHMRNNYLEVEQYPYATFGGRIESVASSDGGRFNIIAAGTVAIHGTERQLRLPCDIVENGEGYRASCSFQILLSDFDIKIPRIMFLKLADEIRIELDFAVEPAASPTGDTE